MVDFKEMLGDEYSDSLTLSELTAKLSEKNVDLVAWDDNKHTTKAKYIGLEKQVLDEKKKRKELEDEINGYKTANMTAEEKSNATIKTLEDKIKNLELDKSKSDARAMYSALGYSEGIVNELVEIDFYEGEDKLAKKNEILKKAKDDVISTYKNQLMNGDTTPTTNPTTTLSKKEQYKSEYQKALAANRGDVASVIMGRALREGINISD